MLSGSEIVAKLTEIKPLLAANYHVSKIGYFGSYSSGKQQTGSDLDLLVEFSQPVWWEFFSLEKYLEQTLGMPVDLVTKNALKDRIKESILNQIRYVWNCKKFRSIFALDNTALFSKYYRNKCPKPSHKIHC